MLFLGTTFRYSVNPAVFGKTSRSDSVLANEPICGTELRASQTQPFCDAGRKRQLELIRVSLPTPASFALRSDVEAFGTSGLKKYRHNAYDRPPRSRIAARKGWEMLDRGHHRMTRQSVQNWISVCAVVLIADQPLASAGPNSDDMPVTAMRSQIRSVQVAVDSKPAPVAADLRAEPVFRYSDPVRQFPDATIWVWEVHHRPVAICKLERIAAPSPGWQFCFASLSDQIVTAVWYDRFEWRAREAGIRWQPVLPPPPSRETDAARLIQMRQLARPFSAVIRNPRLKRQEEMRLLPAPLLRYGDAKGGVRDGALFGLTSNGTNPDMLLLLQLTKSAAGQDEWEYGLHGLTGDEVEIRLQEKGVHAQPYTGRPGHHGTWMWIVFFDDGGVAP